MLIILVVSTTLLNLSLTKFLAQMHNQRSKQTSAVFHKANRASNRGNSRQMTSSYRVQTAWLRKPGSTQTDTGMQHLKKRKEKMQRHAAYLNPADQASRGTKQKEQCLTQRGSSN